MISVMTLIDVMKQSGVVSVGILCRECMGRVAFHREGLDEIKFNSCRV